MAKLNPSFSKLKSEYLFSTIERKLSDVKKNFTSTRFLNFSIGDIALPLAPAIVKALCDAAEEMGTKQGLQGYPPTFGYPFLRAAIAEQEYRGLCIESDEIYISDGINSDAVNILDLLHPASQVGFLSPTYPAYLNSYLMSGRKKSLLIPCTEEQGFIPEPPKEHCDVLYLCTPNNPTGVAMTRSQLQAFVTYALEHEALLFIDSAYSCFVTSPDVPKSIYEIPGAHTCAIEWKSFSKSHGFTGLRCAYSVIPKTLKARLQGKKVAIHPLWEKRQAIKFNGVAYPIQKAAYAGLMPEGRAQTEKQVRTYLSCARQFKKGLLDLEQRCYGGVDAPYLWWKTPKEMSAWQFFDFLLEQCHLIAMPGIGFGPHGEGYVRLSTFSSEEEISLALDRLTTKVSPCILL
jgi:LL-diaminopimelate aminotransferase